MRKLLQLFRANAASAPSALQIKSEGTGPASVYLYDVISADWGISAIALSKAFAELKGRDINLRINSPGGDVFEARAMATAIKAHDGKVTAYVDGLAASAATTVAAAAAEVEIAPGSFYMIHNAWTLAMGDKNSFRETANLLDKVDGAILDDYVAKTGKTSDQIVAWMDAETWFTAQEAVDNGFANRVGAEPPKAKNESRWDVSAYDNAPKILTAAPAPAPVQDSETIAAMRARNERRLRLLKID